MVRIWIPEFTRISTQGPWSRITTQLRSIGLVISADAITGGGEAAASAAAVVARASALPCRWRTQIGGRGREGEPEGGVESEGDREGARALLIHT